MAGKRAKPSGRSMSPGRRKIAALLAGGLVLGIGAAATMAAWTHSQYASATFTSGIFKLESRTNGTAWHDNPESTPAQLAVDVSSLTPGDSGIAYLDIRTTPLSTLGGNTVLQAATKSADSNAGLVDALQIRAKALPSGTTCNAASISDAVFAEALAAPVVGGMQQLSPAGANDIRYCLQIRMKANPDPAIQGKTATLTWNVIGTSRS